METGTTYVCLTLSLEVSFGRFDPALKDQNVGVNVVFQIRSDSGRTLNRMEMLPTMDGVVTALGGRVPQRDDSASRARKCSPLSARGLTETV